MTMKCHFVISRSMRRACVIPLATLAMALLAPVAKAQPVIYLIDPEHTQIWWGVRHLGTSTARGRFDHIAGRIVLDRAAGAGDVSIVVDTASVSSGVPVLDKMLRGTDFLASDAWPQAYFIGNQLRFEAGKLRELRGEFTLRGVSRGLSLIARRFHCRSEPNTQEVCGGDFEATLERSDFGITYGLPFVGNEVALSISIEATRSPGAR